MQKKKKNVKLINEFAHYAQCPKHELYKQKKIFVIHFYNKNEVEGDIFDQMARQYSAHTANSRWPLAV